jgi:hypothetical protein
MVTLRGQRVELDTVRVTQQLLARRAGRHDQLACHL